MIFGENVSFDHYFATYPSAANPAGEPQFVAAAGTPTVNNLISNNLIAVNPNALATSPNTTGRTVGRVTIAGLGLAACADRSATTSPNRRSIAACS
ncbi:hypothetical protein [Paraburkholderia xenovorans]|uniref:hypothetical protein n=1 Tax=Paraburkholderia xenovorans TaxID=36873 RepID=UPI0038BBF685